MNCTGVISQFTPSICTRVSFVNPDPRLVMGVSSDPTGTTVGSINVSTGAGERIVKAIWTVAELPRGGANATEPLDWPRTSPALDKPADTAAPVTDTASHVV